LGKASRDRGQSLVPAPPHKMKGKTLRITSHRMSAALFDAIQE
jgi:hypothetical protein